MAGHDRFERMAVGHVLGGLDEVDAAAFRAHLLACSDCRKRVNELRDIASDLARTEREERRAAGAATVEVETRTNEDAPEAAEVAPVRQWPWGVVVIGLVPLLVLGTLAWAVWQRAQTDLSTAVASTQAAVLEVLASGDEVPLTTSDGVQGSIASDGTTIGVNLTDLPELRPDEAYVLWLLDAEGIAVARPLVRLASQADGAVVASLLHPAAARTVVLSVERELTELTRPAGLRLATGELAGSATTTAPTAETSNGP